MGSNIDNVQFKVTGAVHHVHVMSEAIKKKGKLQNVEFPVQIKTVINGVPKNLGERVYDAVMLIDNKRVHIDAKSWLPEDVVSRLKDSMKGGGVDEGKNGQLLKDLVEMYNKKDVADFKIEWHFDKRSLNPDMTETYLDAIKKELNNPEGGGKLIREMLGLDRADLPESVWKDALLIIERKLDEGFIKIIG